jgi:dTDP-4-amino-4,6-dideoxygalactose transaminase
MVTYDESEKCNYQYVILEIDENVTRISRDQFVDILWAENVIARRYFYPGCHRMEPYRSYFPHAGLLLPETEKLVQRVMALPTGTAVGPAEISQICQIIRLGVEQGWKAREWLQKQGESQEIYTIDESILCQPETV